MLAHQSAYSSHLATDTNCDQIASPMPYGGAASFLPSPSFRPPEPNDKDRPRLNGLPRGFGRLMLPFLTLCISSLSFSRVFGSRIAVRMLFPLALRECDGVRGCCCRVSPTCVLDLRLGLRVGAPDVKFVGLGGRGLGGRGLGSGSGRDVSVGDTGEVIGVEDAMVPPTPVLPTAELILRGAFRVIEHTTGARLVVGLVNAGLCGEPIAMTNGMLTFDATLNLRSGVVGDWIGTCPPVLDAVDPARGRIIAGDIGGGEVAVLSRMSCANDGATTRTLEELELARCRGDWTTCATGSDVWWIASAKTSTCGAGGGLLVVEVGLLENLNRPKRGRCGRSGVDLLLTASGADADRPRCIAAFIISADSPLLCIITSCSGVLGAVYSRSKDSLMLRWVSCRCGIAEFPGGRLVRSSPKLSWSDDET